VVGAGRKERETFPVIHTGNGSKDSNNNNLKEAGGIAQEIEHLPSMHKIP
jgi:hypothetical protein